MNKSLIAHGCWLVAVFVAFALGSMRTGKNVDADGEASAGSGRGVSTSLVGKDGELAKTRARVGAAGGEDAGGLGALGEGRVLTLAEMRALGEQFKTDPNPLKRRFAFAKLLDGLTPENAMDMREFVTHLDSRSSEFIEFHWAWGRVGGEEAVLNGPKTRERDMAATLAGWASADPAAAKDWYAAITKEDGFSQNELKAGLVHGLADLDPALAGDFAFELAQNGDRQADDMLGIAIGKMLKFQGHQAAASWAENQPVGALRASALDRVAHDFVNKDPAAAAAWAERFVGEEHSGRIIEEVGDEWAERDPKSSVAWLQSLDASDGKQAGLNSAFGEWAKRDPTAASSYLNKMPSSPERDSAVSGFVSRLAWENPVDAITWAESIANDRTREGALVSAGHALLRKEPEVARAWLPESGLSAEAQKKVLESRRRR